MTTAQNALRDWRVIVPAAAIVLIVVVVVIFLATRGGTGNAAPASDPGLRTTATRFLRQLNHPLSRLPIVDSSLNSFKAWVYDTQPIFARLAARKGTQFEQVQFVDPSPFPPQAVTITSPGHTAIYPASSIYDRISTSQQPFFATIQAHGKTYRVYDTLLRVPAILQQVGVYAVLEVSEPQT